MKNIISLSQTVSSLTNSPVLSQAINKLSGENITTIILATIAAGTICYVCSNGGNLELSSGDKKIVLSNSERVA